MTCLLSAIGPVGEPFPLSSLAPFPGGGAQWKARDSWPWVRGCQQAPVIYRSAPEALCTRSWGEGAFYSRQVSSRADSENGTWK